MFTAFRIIAALVVFVAIGLFICAIKGGVDEEIAKKQRITTHCHEIDRQYFKRKAYVSKMQCDDGKIIWDD